MILPNNWNAELLGQMDQATTEHAYPPKVWSPGEVVVDTVQISSADLQAGSYAVWMGLYSPATQIRVSVEAGTGVDSEDRAWMLEFQLEHCL